MRGGSKPGERRGGREKGVPNKATREIKAVAQLHGPQAIAELVRIMTSSESDSARVTAARELLDRGYGKPAQSLEHSGPEGQPIEVHQQPTNADIAKVLVRLFTEDCP